MLNPVHTCRYSFVGFLSHCSHNIIHSPVHSHSHVIILLYCSIFIMCHQNLCNFSVQCANRRRSPETTVSTIKGGGSVNCSSIQVSLARFCVLTVLIGPGIVLVWLAALVIEPRPPKGKGYTLRTLIEQTRIYS